MALCDAGFCGRVAAPVGPRGADAAASGAAVERAGADGAALLVRAVVAIGCVGVAVCGEDACLVLDAVVAVRKFVTGVTTFAVVPETRPVTGAVTLTVRVLRVFTPPTSCFVEAATVAVTGVTTCATTVVVALLTVLVAVVTGAVGRAVLVAVVVMFLTVAAAVLTVVVGAAGALLVAVWVAVVVAFLAVAVAVLTVVVGAAGAVLVAVWVADGAVGAGAVVTALETASTADVGVATVLEVEEASGVAGTGVAATARLGVAATIPASHSAARNHRNRVRTRSPTSVVRLPQKYENLSKTSRGFGPPDVAGVAPIHSRGAGGSGVVGVWALTVALADRLPAL
ncbi:MAG TPA: hypothetical protein VLC49_06575 [Solirubrobacteraceae bacterium]|nr:hypothetical protein [Solirubrobacteraceae bacterium]